MARGKQLNINCPKCDSSFNYYDSNFRPFCSERCKQVDLGLWFSETYSVASKESLKEDDLEKIMSSLEGQENE